LRLIRHWPEPVGTQLSAAADRRRPRSGESLKGVDFGALVEAQNGRNCCQPGAPIFAKYGHLTLGGHWTMTAWKALPFS